MEIRGHGGITHFGNSEGRGELNYGSHPWYGMDIFWNCPIHINFINIFIHFSKLQIVAKFCISM